MKDKFNPEQRKRLMELAGILTENRIDPEILSLLKKNSKDGYGSVGIYNWYLNGEDPIVSTSKGTTFKLSDATKEEIEDLWMELDKIDKAVSDTTPSEPVERRYPITNNWGDIEVKDKKNSTAAGKGARNLGKYGYRGEFSSDGVYGQDLMVRSEMNPEVADFFYNGKRFRGTKKEYLKWVADQKTKAHNS